MLIARGLLVLPSLDLAPTSRHSLATLHRPATPAHVEATQPGMMPP